MNKNSRAYKILNSVKLKAENNNNLQCAGYQNKSDNKLNNTNKAVTMISSIQILPPVNSLHVLEDEEFDDEDKGPNWVQPDDESSCCKTFDFKIVEDKISIEKDTDSVYILPVSETSNQELHFEGFEVDIPPSYELKVPEQTLSFNFDKYSPTRNVLEDEEIDDEDNDPNYIPTEDESSCCKTFNFEIVETNKDLIDETDVMPNTKRNKYRNLVDQQKHNTEKHPILSQCDCRLKCFEKIPEEMRMKIHLNFWKLDRHMQRLWLNSNISEIDIKRRLTESKKKRLFSRIYNLPTNTLVQCNENSSSFIEEKVIVCQKMFLRTLGYNNNTVVNCMLKAKRPNDDEDILIVPKMDSRGKYIREENANVTLVKDHINSYNPQFAHYRRSHAPNRKYLPPDLTINLMYKNYCDKHNDQISYEFYRKIFKQMNISFYMACAEKCGFCLEMDEDPTDENLKRKQLHLEKDRQARTQYRLDQNESSPEYHIFAADMQKIVLLPKMPDVKETFFTPRLVTINETFVALNKNGSHYCILWHEAIKGRKMEDVASAFIKFFAANRDLDHIVIWMDNCTGQNKNFALYSAIITYLNNGNTTTKSIELKYLVAGHTFMAADGIHGQIEQIMRRQNTVYDFEDFKQICDKSSKRMTTITMDPPDFYSFINIIRNRRSIKDKADIPYFQDIVHAKFVLGCTDIYYKTNFEEMEFFKTENTLKKGVKFIDIKPVVGAVPRGISENKKKKIIDQIVGKMPKNRRLFWENLTSNIESKDLLDEGF